MDFFIIESGKILTKSIIQFIITLVIGSILLHLATGFLGFKNRSITKAIGTVLTGDIIAFFLGFIPILGQFLGLISFWFIIKKIYDVGWIKAILAWIMSILITFIIAIIILFLLGFSIFIIN